MASHGQKQSKLRQRVVHAAETALDQQKYVAPVDVLVGLGWLAPSAIDRWRQGRVDYLERVVDANLHKISAAVAEFRRWARGRNLQPSETRYVARTRDRRALRFSKTGDPAIEQAYRTHWVSPALSAARQEKLAEKQSRPPDLVVISALNDWTCTECSGSGNLLIMEDAGPLCLTCADMDHLVFLRSGDAALTRRAKKASSLTAVVVRFSRSRRRYERQGLLIEQDALALAEEECLADDVLRRARRERDAELRARQDVELQGRLADEILQLFPSCPAERATAIARHTSERHSSRVGRSAAGRSLDAEAVTLAVVADVRHRDTRYDGLLMTGIQRAEARELVRADVQRVLTAWRTSADASR